MSLYSDDPEAKKAMDSFVDCWIAYVKKNMPAHLKKAIREFNKELERRVAEWLDKELKKKGFLVSTGEDK